MCIAKITFMVSKRVSKRCRLSLPKEITGTPFLGSPRVTPGLMRSREPINAYLHCKIWITVELKLLIPCQKVQSRATRRQSLLWTLWPLSIDKLEYSRDYTEVFQQTCVHINDVKNSSSLSKGNYENPGFVDSPQKSPSVEFDHYGVRRKSIPIISANIELELDHNFYNLLIITFGLFLCGVITGLTWVYSSIWHSEMLN